jgi:thiol:disulfide interchange protein DsbD
MGTLSVAVAAVFATLFGPAILRPAQASPLAQAGSRWQAWEPGRVEQILASGQPVMVDFTAAWCVTCQFNKKTTLANDQVLSDLTAKNVQLLQADWTRRDPAITAALTQLGRSGVPLYVIYKPGSAPVVMSEVLGVDELRSAIARL